MTHRLEYRWTVAAAAVTLALGAVLTGAAANYQRNMNAESARAAIARATATVADDVVERVHLYEYGVRAARGAILLGGEDNLTRAGFFAYSQSRDIAREFPGANSFGFIRRVKPADEARFVADSRRDGKSDFRILQLSPNGGDRYVIQYIEPAAGVSAFGLDIASEPHRRVAAEMAMRTGLATLSAPIAFINRPDSPPQSYLLLLPVYRQGMPATTAQEREQNLFGWTYASLTMNEVIKHVRLDSSAFHLVLRDITDVSAPEAVYRTTGSETEPYALSNTAEREILGRRWQVQLSASPAFVANLGHVSPSWVFAIGMVASLLMSALASVADLSRQRKAIISRRQIDFTQQLEQQVIERTRQLKRSNGLLNGVLQSASETAIIATDASGIVTVFNRGAERILGYTSDEIIGIHTPLLFLSEGELAARANALSLEFGAQISGLQILVHRASQGAADTHEWKFLHKDGRAVPVSLVVTAIRDDSGAVTGYLGVAEDITERIETTIALREAKAAAESANLAKSTFLATMSHELRTPMAGVLGSAELLLGSDLDAGQHQLVQTLMKSAQSLLELLNDILDFAKIEAGRMELEESEFSIRAIVDDVCSTIAPLAANNHNAIDVDVDRSVRQIFLGDGKRYRQILTNLVGNANKFTKSGKIHIAIREVAHASGIGLQTLVTDTGIGIAQDNCSRLFQPFVQEDASTSRRFGGTGLGLALCKSFVELMGGRIWVISELGRGSTFGFVVGLRAGHGLVSAESKEHVDSHPVAPMRPLSILVAEDNEANRALICAMLTKLGHTSVGVENGALAVSELERGTFDLILMDMQMPVMDGPAAMRVIRSNGGPWSSIPIIALTADAIPAHHARYLQAGATAIATKPVSWAKLNRLMAELSAQSQQALQSAAWSHNASTELLDVELLQEMLAGIGAVELTTLIEKLAAQLEEMVPTLHDALADADSIRIRSTAHSLKGLASQFGAVRLSEIARDVEAGEVANGEMHRNASAIDDVARRSLQALRAWNESIHSA